MARLPNQNMTPGRPVKPAGLSKVASAEWDRLVKELQQSNIHIAKAHGLLIELAVAIVSDMAYARKTVEKEGEYILNKRTGDTKTHPAARRLDSLRRDYVKVLSALGLRTPVSSPVEDGPSLEDMLNAKRML